jgi:EAL domain-containing protein (putative c-di-GMP-specific phosphodiesterase class I)/tetratricopeptide (TPR) repeat protein
MPMASDGGKQGGRLMAEHAAASGEWAGWSRPLAPSRVDVLVGLAEARRDDNAAAAADLAERAAEEARKEGEDAALSRALSVMIACRLGLGTDPLDLLAASQESVESARRSEDRTALAQALVIAADLVHRIGLLDESAAAAREVLGLAIELGDATMEAKAHLRMATTLASAAPAGGEHRYREHFRAAADRFFALGDEAGAGRALYNLAVSHHLAGENHDALKYFDEARPLLAEASTISILVESQRAIVLARLGYHEAAVAALRTADERRRSRPVDAFVHTLVDLSDGTVRRHAGELDAARRILADVGEDALRQNDLEVAASAWNELATVCEELGDHVGALAAFRRHHEAFGRMHADAMERRLRGLEVASKLEEAQRRTDVLAASHSELQAAVDVARDDLARATRRLEVETARRSLVEKRSGANGGVERMTGLSGPAGITRVLDEQLRDADGGVCVAVITIDDERTTAADTVTREHVVQELAARLQAFVNRVSGFAGSLGTEDLVAIIPGDLDPSMVALLQQLNDQLTLPMVFGGRTLTVTIQLGVAAGPAHGLRANPLLSRARLTARAARRSRPVGPVVAIFDPLVEERLRIRAFVAEELPRALDTELIEVHYQPIVAVQTGRIVGAEALARWSHPERGVMAPSLFVPLAEETGHVAQLGEYVLEHACREAMSWPTRLAVSVNVSPLQLSDGLILQQIDEALNSSGLEPSRLCVELTESVLTDAVLARGVLTELRERGVTVRIDDFGCGYSSLGYLSSFPVDGLKVDRTFVERVHENANEAAITQAIATMAHAMNLDVVAEGLEHPEQLAVLRKQGYDSYQGWHCAPALAPHRFRALLAGTGALHREGVRGRQRTEAATDLTKR